MLLSKMIRDGKTAFTGALFLLSLAAVQVQAVEQLSQDVVPTFEAISMKIDAAQLDYTGSARVDLDVRRDAETIQFHAEDMTLISISLSQADRVIEQSYDVGERGVVTLTPSEPLSTGQYRLEIEFANDLSTQSTSLYQVKTGGYSYTFTQFEPDDAREAFPCWDEPRFKIPFQMTLTVPEQHVAVSNTPVEKEQVTDGWRTVVFRRTKPLPAYLLALSTGPLEFVEIPGMSIPGRVVTARGKKHLAEEAVRVTPPLLSALEEYFAQPYPYEKLDLIAVPEFWFGAMENVGLIVYKENLLLLDPQIASISEKRHLASVTAHELAHMWFGNLVTMEWWDDIWLNESFASWMDTKITSRVFPQYRVDLDVHNSTNRAMKIDARPSTRAVRRPVLASDNLVQIFDALSYSKGEAVLTMFERWLGEERFRTGVNDYLRANLWGNAAAAEFWVALTKATGVDLNTNMAPFLDQGGVPLVDMEYAGDGQAIFTQSRFANYGVNPPSPTVWSIPLQIRFSDGVAVQTKTVLLNETSQVVDLSTERDLVWVYPNDGAAGYYRWKVPPEMLAAMAAKSLQIMKTGERISFLHNLAALLDGGYIRGDDYLKMLSYFAEDPDPNVISALIAGLDKVKYSLITPDVEDAFAVYVRQTLGPSLKRFGLQKTYSEDETVSMFRPELIDWLADEGQDKDVLKYAVSLAEKYNDDAASIDPQLIETVVYLSSLYGGRELFEDYRRRFETAEVPSIRSRYLSALGSFRDPEIVQTALAYVFEGPMRPHELETVPYKISEYQPYRDRVYHWIIDHYDQMCSLIPAVNAADMPYWAEGCSADRLAAARTFFSQPEHSPPGTEESMAKVSDMVSDCVSLRDREGDAVAAYLRQVAAR